MNKFLMLAGTAVLATSCATMQLVQTPEGPKVPAFSEAKTVSLALASVDYPSGLIEIYQDIPGQGFVRGKPLDGVSNWVEYRDYPPMALTKHYSPEQISSFILAGVEQALVGAGPFRFDLTATDFSTVIVSDADSTGKIVSSPNTFEVKRVAFPKNAKPAEFAKSTGTDLTVVVTAHAIASSGRGSDQLNEKAVMPLRLDQGKSFVLVDIQSDIQVFNAQGALVFDSWKDKDKYHFYKGTSTITLLPEVSGADALDAFVTSKAFQDLVIRGAFFSTADYIRALRPHVVGTYVEVKEPKK